MVFGDGDTEALGELWIVSEAVGSALACAAEAPGNPLSEVCALGAVLAFGDAEGFEISFDEVGTG